MCVEGVCVCGGGGGRMREDIHTLERLFLIYQYFQGYDLLTPKVISFRGFGEHHKKIV